MEATQRQKCDVIYEIVIVLVLDRRKVFIRKDKRPGQLVFPCFIHDKSLNSEQKRSLSVDLVLNKLNLFVDSPVSETEAIHQLQGNWHVSTCYRIDVSVKDSCRMLESGDWKQIDSVLDSVEPLSYVRTVLELLGLAKINSVRI